VVFAIVWWPTIHSITNGMTELRNTPNESTKDASNAKLAFDIEKKLSEQLTALKADVLSTQSLQTQISELRELKATSDERCVAKDRKIHDMNEQIAQLHVVTNTLTEKLNQAEAQLCEHTSPSDADLESAKLELEEAKRKLATADEIETTLRTELDALKESISLKDGEISSITKNALESGREVILPVLLLAEWLALITNRPLKSITRCEADWLRKLYNFEKNNSLSSRTRYIN
jgi:chromosome segregation ATPase